MSCKNSLLALRTGRAGILYLLLCKLTFRIITASVEYTIKAKDIAGATVGAFAPMTYTGKAQTPAATVTLDGFGEVTGSWSEVLNVGDKTTFTASGNYVGALTVVAQMTPQTVAVVSAKVEDVAFDADGEYTLVVTDVVFDAVELAAGVDYTAEAQLVGENVEGATSEVLITFTMLNGNYVLATHTLSTTVTLLHTSLSSSASCRAELPPPIITTSCPV